nr:aminopeptidase [Hoeflea prorocentri]
MMGALLVLQGCAGISYVNGSLSGHLELMSSAQPVERLLYDDATPEQLKGQLALAREIRQFAIDQLGLPDNRSYRSYVDTEREFVTWAVFAAPELSLQVKTWCFPVTGCVPYRGYFSNEAAVAFARGLHEEGLDVYIGGVPAYSTLGWFNDPLLNTMFLRGEPYLAGVVFHELSHQQVYVAGDSAFNEAFAVSVEQTGTEAWLNYRGETEALRRYRQSLAREKDFLALIAQTRSDLFRVYSGSGSQAEKRAGKKAAIETMRARYRRLKAQKWNGYDGYDAWINSPINNAKLATVSVYNDLVPQFLRLLELCSGDYPRYYKTVKRLSRLGKDKRREALQNSGSCG